MQVWLLCPVHRGPYFEGGAEIQEDVKDTLGGGGGAENRREYGAGRRMSCALAFLCENSLKV